MRRHRRLTRGCFFGRPSQYWASVVWITRLELCVGLLLPIFNPVSTSDKVEYDFVDRRQYFRQSRLRVYTDDTAHSGFRDARHDFSVVRQKTRRERQDATLSTLGVTAAQCGHQRQKQ